jgi:signal transduction histidine kinase
LRRQLFAWLALTIVVTGIAVWTVLSMARVGADTRMPDIARMEAFVSERYLDSWHDAPRRRALSESLARALRAGLRVDDADGRTLEQVRGGCQKPNRSLTLRRAGLRLGSVHACFDARAHGHLLGFLALGTALLVLWVAASVLARKLTRPLSSLIAVTREIGAGNSKSRVRLQRGRRGELGVLADAINDMAERIERQLNEQRELLAAVSHEVRSPLARMRISTELLRDNPSDRRALDAIDSEVSEIDSLVGKLLASSRLDFGTLARTPLSAADLAGAALERHQLPRERLEIDGASLEFSGDPTLVARALDNLLDNAEEHGKGLARLVVRPARPGEHDHAERAVVFEVWDRGPGFERQALTHAFEAFFRGPRPAAESRASLGLGLALVQRIARAHGGRAWAENSASGGARVSFGVG